MQARRSASLGACGAIVGSPKQEDSPEVAGEGALYFDPIDVRNMASVLGNLMVDSQLRRDAGQKALKRAGSYSWSTTTDKTLSVLLEAVK